MSEKQIWIVSREYAGIAEAGGVKMLPPRLLKTWLKKALKSLFLSPNTLAQTKKV